MRRANLMPARTTSRPAILQQSILAPTNRWSEVTYGRQSLGRQSQPALFASSVFVATFEPPSARALSDELAVEDLPPVVGSDGVCRLRVGRPSSIRVRCRRTDVHRCRGTTNRRWTRTIVARRPKQGEYQQRQRPTLPAATTRANAEPSPAIRRNRGQPMDRAGRRNFQPISGSNRKQIGHQIIGQLITTAAATLARSFFNTRESSSGNVGPKLPRVDRIVGLMLQELLQHGAVWKRRPARQRCNTACNRANTDRCERRRSAGRGLARAKCSRTFPASLRWPSGLGRAAPPGAVEPNPCRPASPAPRE